MFGQNYKFNLHIKKINENVITAKRVTAKSLLGEAVFFTQLL